MKQKLLILLSSLFILVGCANFREPLIKNTVIEVEIPIQDRPKAVDLLDVKFYVVTKENLNDFLKRFEKDNGEVVFYAISVQSYENLALNIGQLRRYINQQQNLIVYYESSIKNQ